MALGSLAVTVGGCSSSTNTATTGPGSGSGSGSTGTGSGSGEGNATCTNPALTIAFAPMYSAVIPGDNTHTFQVPAIVNGVTASAITWSASSNAVSLASDPSTGGVLITMSPSGTGGTVTITANAGGLCGTSTLNITSATLADWTAGSNRYNNGVALTAGGLGGGPGGMMTTPPDGGYRYACTDCHAPKGTDAGPGFNDVAHTPEQTGGYSDEQLLAIVQSGEVPGWSTDAGPAGDAGYFDTTIIPFRQWHRFHQWGLTTEEQKGIVVYLRSLQPAAQTGTSNFGGFGPPPDGGYHHHHDGGSGPGSSTGSGSGAGPADATTGG